MRRTNELAAAELDVESTLAGVARLTLPYAGVRSVVDICDGDRVHRVAISHPVPEVQRLASRLADEWPPARDSDARPRILRTGETELVARVSDESLGMHPCSPDQLIVLRGLGIGSVLTVAMRGEEGIVGSITFVGPRDGHVFDDRDRRLAEDVAAGAAIAIAVARLAAARARRRPAAETTSAERLSFMSSLSHGVRTPLHNIFGYAQLLEAGVRGPLTDAQRSDIGGIRENERHLLNLVDAVINFARWDDGDPVILEDVVVRDALQRADRDLAGFASKRAVRYQRDHADIPAHLVVRAELRRLTEIFTQVLDNAIKFSRPGDSVVVRAMSVGDCVWIRVSDTGIGIDEEDLGLIFHPLVRGRDAYALKQDGVGLGLAISRKLARSMDGDISVVSTRGDGSTFTIALPQGRQASPAVVGDGVSP